VTVANLCRMQYDPTAGYVVMWGGWTNTVSIGDSWKFLGGTWTNITGGVGTAPAPRGWAASTYDPRTGSVMVWGGATFGSGSYFDDTWELTTSGGSAHWANLTRSAGPAPPARRMASMAYAPAYGYDLMLAGDVAFGGYSGPAAGNFGDVRALNNGSWVNLTGSMIVVPPGRFAAALFYDPTAGALVLFGGCTNIGCISGLNDTWRYEWNFTASLSESAKLVQVGDSISLSSAAGGGPIASYQSYAYSGLPPGCTSKNTTLLVCVPTGTGNYTPSVNVTLGGGWTNFTGATSAIAYGPTFQVVSALTLTTFASPSELDAGGATWINSSSAGGAGGDSYSYTGLPAGCSSSNTSALECVPTASGTFVVHVTVRDAGGETTSQTVNLTVHPKVTVQGISSTNAIDLGENVTFTASAAGGTGGPYTYDWTAAGGGCSGLTGLSITCTPPAVTTLSVDVAANDSLQGHGSYAFAPVRVLALPSVAVQAAPTSGAAPLSVTFQAEIEGGLAPYDVEWAFGDDLSAASANTTHSYGASGTYNATFWANDSLGKGTHMTVVVHVGTAPDLYLTASPTRTELGGVIVLVATVAGGEPPLSYAWSGLPTGCSGGDVAQLNCTPTTPGTYLVVASVEDAYSSAVHQTLSVSVAEVLSASASYEVAGTSTCPSSETVNFTAYATGGVAPFTYQWSFGDGEGSSEASPSHSYTFPSTPPASEPASVIVTDSLGFHSVANSTVDIVAPTSCSGPTTPPGTPLPWVPIGIGIGVLIVVAVVAGVWLGRRRPPAAPPGDTEPTQPPSDQLGTTESMADDGPPLE
jgi:PKD repeat protein